MINNLTTPFRPGEGAPRGGLLSLPETGMGFFLYSSVALFRENAAETAAILDIARLKNAANGVTGFLHREEDLFFQYVEGPSEVMRKLWGKLNRDPRHGNLRLLSSGAIQARRFEAWQMGFSSRASISLFDWLSEPVSGRTRRLSSAEDVVEFMRLAASRL